MTDQPIEPQQWFTTDEAAEYMRMSPKALRMLVSRGTIAPDHWGGRKGLKGHRWSRATLERFLREKAA